MAFIVRYALRLLPALAVAGTLLTATHAFAQEPTVQVVLAGKRVVTQEGRESMLDADKARPGDLIQYEATCRNTGKSLVKNVAATIPVPKGMELKAESAKPAGAQASIEGKDFNSMPLLRDVKNAAGIIEKQPVPLTEYRALRWIIPELAPGGTAIVSLRVQVVTNSAKP